MTTFAIDTQGLRKEFGEKVAVADLTLQVQQNVPSFLKSKTGVK